MVVEAKGILTDKELELITQLCLPYKIIGQNMGVDGNSVRMRTSRLALKLGVENRASVIIKALKLGLITIDKLVYRSFDGK